MESETDFFLPIHDTDLSPPPTSIFSSITSKISQNYKKLKALIGDGYPNITCTSIFLLISFLMIAMFYGRFIEKKQEVIPLLLISLDGFRPDYLNRTKNNSYLAKNLNLFAKDGVRSWMKSVFPSVTFPNHWSIITGLYPSTHGLVNNIFYAPEFNDTFIYTNITCDEDEKWWKDGTPFWYVVEKMGWKSGICMWPGSEASHNQILPSYLIPYSNMSNDLKVNQVLKWLDMKDGDRPRFMTLYLNDVDSIGHSHGPNSPQMSTTIEKLDTDLGILLEKTKDINVIIVSDHGMAETSSKREIILDDYLDLSLVNIISHHPVAFIQPYNHSDTMMIYERLKNASLESEGRWNVWLRNEMEYLNYTHPHVSSIVALPSDGWIFIIKSKGEGRGKWIMGTHGFDPNHPDMHSLYLARGPMFKKGTMMEGGWRNVELWQLFARLIGLDKRQWRRDNNGTEEGMIRFESILM